MKKWFKENWFIILLAMVALVAITVALVFAIGDTNGTFDIVKWTSNPSNPASPVGKF